MARPPRCGSERPSSSCRRRWQALWPRSLSRCSRREHQDEGARRLDTPDDLVAEITPGLHVTRRDPAFDAVSLKRGGDVRGLLGVGLGMADEGYGNRGWVWHRDLLGVGSLLNPRVVDIPIYSRVPITARRSGSTQGWPSRRRHRRQAVARAGRYGAPASPRRRRSIASRRRTARAPAPAARPPRAP